MRYAEHYVQFGFLSNHNKDFKQSLNDNKVKTLILAGCNSASDPFIYSDDNKDYKNDVSITQLISEDHRDWEVVGSTGYVSFSRKKGIVAVSSKYEEDRNHKNDGYNDKGFVKYKGGKKLTKNERGKGVKSRQPHSNRLKHTNNNHGVKPKLRLRFW